MLLATTIELTDGLVAHGLPGQGRLAEVADSARYDARHVHTDLLVVGAGPTGLSRRADRSAGGRQGRRGRRPVRSRRVAAGQCRAHRRRPCAGLGPTCHRRAGRFPRRPAPAAHHRVRALRRRVRPRAGAAHRPPRRPQRRATCRGSASGASAHGACSWRPARTSGPSCSPTTTGPASCSPAPLAPSCTATAFWPGRAAVVFTCDDSAYAAAVDLADAGVEVRAVVDARPRPPAVWRAACASRGIPVSAGQVVTATEGVERVSPRRSWRPSSTGCPASRTASTAICCWSAAAGTPRSTCSARRAESCATTPRSGRSSRPSHWPRRRSRGRRPGVFDLAGCLVDGHAGAATATDGLGVDRRR